MGQRTDVLNRRHEHVTYNLFHRKEELVLDLQTEFRVIQPVVVTPEDVTHGKPSPEMFLLVARLMGVAPERCLVFEDGRPGFEAAARPAWSAWWSTAGASDSELLPGSRRRETTSSTQETDVHSRLEAVTMAFRNGWT